ncbi:STM4504/CBY_0614 family protein [Vreelandella venusta]|uniref:Abortive infection protein-like C-terminal domain-containing protein n=1 Tax=Vreelandella venusta TaxID=44935 RepID=A0ABX2B5Z6_9GAMM|nr:hypothetical protein [Halomonas venusta]AZM95024.1 hypothetical protein EI420_04660 [Halomonas venusta]NPT29525.1 hypothetical protein [Halomonas venusta]
MAIFELFSKRQKKQRGEMPDVYVYEEIPQSFRVQIIHIIRDTFGEDRYSSDASSSAYEFIHKALCKEYGVFTLNEYARSDSEAILEYFLNCSDYENCLDVIEISFSLIENYVGENYYNYKQRTTSSQDPEDAVEELNKRFKEAGIGYEFSSGELIRIDSQLIHSEVVKPVLALLKTNRLYNGANQEFLKAHENYRHKRYKECLVECLKSIESLMKGVCKQHSWEFKESDPAKKLINICLENKLVPEYLQNQFSSLRILLESGVPTIRNREGGHGQGPELSTVPEHFASYTLHLTASNLLFLMQCNEQLTNKGSGR